MQNKARKRCFSILGCKSAFPFFKQGARFLAFRFEKGYNGKKGPSARKEGFL